MRKPSRLVRRLGLTAAIAGAAFGSGGTHAADATPLACSGPCTVIASFAGYVAPVTEITSGSTISFTSIDTTHPTHEGTGSSIGASDCFVETANAISPTSPVQFNLAGDGTVSTASGPCTSGIALPDLGSTVVPYRCALHPNMIGLLVVSA